MDHLFDVLVDKHGLIAAMQIVEDTFAKADQETQELFGDREYVSEEELAIVWNDGFSHEEKLRELVILRAGKESTGPFANSGEAIRARSLGVKL